MKIVLQRVSRASLTVKGKVIASISKGVLILFGAEKNDDEGKVQFLVEKTLNLRIFPDEKGKMNLSCLDIGGNILVVSQFTLAGNCSKGRRPTPFGAIPRQSKLRYHQNIAANIETRQVHLAFFIRKNSKIKRFLNKKLNFAFIVIFFSTKKNEDSFRDGSNDFTLNRQ